MRPTERPEVAEKRKRLSDPKIRRWYDNLARGSEITANNYLRSLFGFASRAGISVSDVAKLSKKQAYEALLDFVSAEEKRGISGSAIATYVKAVRSWLAHNGVVIDQRIRVKGAQSTPTLKGEQVPSQQDLRKILLAGTSQQRVAVALVAFSGVRLEVVGNYRGTDGLRVSDIPELEIKDGKVSFGTLPARVVVREELSKTGNPYFSWIGEEGASYLAANLEERVRGGEAIGPETDVFHPASYAKRFVKSVNVSEAIRSAIDRAGFDFRPYNLRCYFDTQTLLSESKGKVAHDYRTFWMGHKGTIENRYTTNKGRLPRELLEDMRAAYHRCEAFLSTTQTPAERERMTLAVKAGMLEVAGYEREEAERLAEDPDADIPALVRKKLGVGTGTDAKPGSKAGEQKVVDAGSVSAYLGAGWTFKGPLNSHAAVVEWGHDGR